ncbi:MAG: hypothetical protein HOV80_19635 [Polyangiaceae bacterium]|nr:hypothetical protein [Polyangiaceae bacterium]
MLNRGSLVVALLATLLGACTTKGTCVIEKKDEHAAGGTYEVCIVNYNDKACEAEGKFTSKTGDAGAAFCATQGFTEARRDARPMNNIDVNKAFERGDSVYYGRPASAPAK